MEDEGKETKKRHFNIKKKILVSIVILIMLLSTVFIFSVSATSTWSKPRPSDDATYNETIGNADTDGIASIGMGVDIAEYYEDDQIMGDFLTFRVSVSANTRKGIEYYVYEEPSDYHWYEVSTPTGIIYDNQATKILLPFTVQYYGVIYDEVWVYDDGFISFDPNRTSTTPQNIPSTEKPNSIVAPFWRDLNPQAGGSITYGTAEAYEFFIISWNNVPNKDNGVPQTFQIVINNYGAYSYDFQNVIFFQYEDITLDQPTAVGIEDQVGVQSSTLNYTGLYNELRLKFKYWTEGYRLVKLTTKLTKNDDNHAKVNFIHTDIGGYNVIIENPEDNPYGSLFFSAIGLAADFLFPLDLGIMFGHFLIVPDLALDLSENLSPPSFEVKDAKEYDNEAYVYSIADLERKPGYAPFDATLASNLIWSFTDPNNRDHSLTVAAELTYQDFQVPANCYTISTSVTLNMYINQPPATPSTPSGPNSGYQDYIYFYSTNTTDPEGDLLQYQFDWGDNTNKTVEWYNSGDNATAAHSWADVGTYYVTVRAKDYYGLWSDWSQPLAVSISTPPPPPGGGGGGGCPYVSTWDGGKYVLDNNLLPASELINETDVEDYYRLEQALVPLEGKYSLRISEFEQEHSYIDQVKLLAVDHEPDVNIAVTQDGKILTYKNPAAPISAVDNNGSNRLNEISLIDGNVSDPNTYFYGRPGDYLLLNFGQVDSDNAKLVLRTDIKKVEDPCIMVQVRDSDSRWQTVEVLVPRAYWSIEAVNLTPHITQGQDLLVRLYWTQPHRLDYVGLDTTKQDDYELHTANLVSATHSTQGDVKPLLLNSDNTYAELVPNQQIQLEFTLPNNSKQARTHILYTKGRYYTIP